MTDIIKMPKGGIQDAAGQLTPAGHSLIAAITDRVSVKPAGSAEEFLEGGRPLIRSEALWGTMKPIEVTGGGSWSPDLGSRLSFKRTLDAPLTILYPSNIPDGDSEPFFSVWLTQNSTGGWPVDFGTGFQGSNPTVLTGPGDRTLLGFNVIDETQFTAWSVKGIQA